MSLFSIIARITADSSGLQVGLKRAEGLATAFGNNIENGLGSKLRKAFGVAAIIGFTKSAVNLGDELYRMAQQTGLTVEQVQGIKKAADEAGISFEAMQKRIAEGSGKMAEGLKLTTHEAKTLHNVSVDLKGFWTGAVTQASRFISAMANSGTALWALWRPENMKMLQDSLEIERSAQRRAAVDQSFSAAGPLPASSFRRPSYDIATAPRIETAHLNAMQKIGSFSSGVLTITEQQKTNKILNEMNQRARQAKDWNEKHRDQPQAQDPFL